MVQEFTGIPSPPFINSSPFGRNRLDLFASSLDSPLYLRRPFAQKFQSPALPFLNGNNVINTPPHILNNSTTASSSSPRSNIFSNVDQGFFLGGSVNSLQGSTHEKINDLFGLGSKVGTGDHQVHDSFGVSSTSSASDHHQLGLGNNHVSNVNTEMLGGGLANLISSSDNNNVISNIRNDVIGNENRNAATWNNGTRRDRENVDQYDITTNTSMSAVQKTFNYSNPSAASNFNGQKGTNTSGREGMVETWICNSSE